MSDTNGTGHYVVEVPAVGSVPMAPDKNHLGRLVWLIEEADWVPVHFIDSDVGWAPASERPPQPPTVFESKVEAEAKLRHTQRRAEVLAAATSGAASPYLMAARVVEAAALETKRDFEAEVAVEKRAAKLEDLVKAEQRATSRREAEEHEIQQIRRESKAELERLRQEATSGDWASVGGMPKIQHRIRTNGTEAFRARVDGKVSPTFESLDEALAWRDERTNAEPALVGAEPSQVLGTEGSRPQ